MSDLLLLELAMYRSWVTDQRGFDLSNSEVMQLLRDTRACEILQIPALVLAARLDASVGPEHREALVSLRRKTGFDARAPEFPGESQKPGHDAL